jgi:hypothetical protein
MGQTTYVSTLIELEPLRDREFTKLKGKIQNKHSMHKNEQKLSRLAP